MDFKKLGNDLENKAHEIAENEKVKKAVNKAEEIIDKGVEKAKEFSKSEEGQKIQAKTDELIKKGESKVEKLVSPEPEQKIKNTAENWWNKIK